MTCLPEFNRLVVARLEGTRHHSGLAWARDGWAFLVRWDDNGEHTVENGWGRDRYDTALRHIDADYADVVEWIYVSDLSEHSTRVFDKQGVSDEHRE